MVCHFFENYNQTSLVGNQTEFFMHFLVMSGNGWLGWTCFLLVLYGLDFVTDAIGEDDNAKKVLHSPKVYDLCHNDP